MVKSLPSFIQLLLIKKSSSQEKEGNESTNCKLATGLFRCVRKDIEWEGGARQTEEREKESREKEEEERQTMNRRGGCMMYVYNTGAKLTNAISACELFFFFTPSWKSAFFLSLSLFLVISRRFSRFRFSSGRRGLRRPLASIPISKLSYNARDTRFFLFVDHFISLRFTLAFDSTLLDTVGHYSNKILFE